MALLSTFAVIAYSLVTVMYFEPLRDGTFKLIDLGNMQGLVSIPSFHTVLAILLSHAMRRTRVAAVFWVLNAWMIVSTPLRQPLPGRHYRGGADRHRRDCLVGKGGAEKLMPAKHAGFLHRPLTH